jgi:transposase
LGVLRRFQEAKCKPVVVMEPTGTYGDAVRHQCHAMGLPVHMMPPKHSHDFAEVLDGVPSMHDPKAATVLARLQAIKPARPWEPESVARRDLRAWVDQRRPIARTLALYQGHLEAMLARHWPEFAAHFDVYDQRSWFALLKEFPGPEAVSAAGEAAAQTLRKASRGHLGQARIRAIVDSARSTTGVPMTAGEQERLRVIADQIEVQTRRLDAVDATLAALVAEDEVLRRIATVVGPACAGAIGSLVGSPLDFPNARALEKAIGLNLKEKSSGNKQGQMSITKRGPGEVRRLLFMAALRFLKDDATARAWCHARKAYVGDQKIKAVVALMRKLARALWHVARGEVFDAAKLFDTRRLDLPSHTIRRTNTAAPASSLGRAPEPCQGGAAIA